MSRRTDGQSVTVAGAGPAGLVAAITLARAGTDVVVCDRQSDAGLRFNGDFQGLENWSTREDVCEWLRDLGIDIDFTAAPFRSGTFYSPSGQEYRAQSTRPIFYLVRRGSQPDTLDQALKRQALAAGVRFAWGTEVRSFLGRTVIAATGPKTADVIAKGIVFETHHPDACFGFLDDTIAPKGYSYLLVHGGHATLASCMYEDFRNERTYFERTLERVRDVVGIDIVAPREFGGYGNFFFTDTFEATTDQGRVLYAGESVGLQDALWGFGSRYAIESGYCAAQSILTSASYSQLCRQRFHPRMRATLTDRWLFGRLGNGGYEWWMRRLFRGGDIVDSLRRLYQPSLLRTMASPLARRAWKTRLLDKRCSHDDCACVWCRHGSHEGSASCGPEPTQIAAHIEQMEE